MNPPRVLQCSSHGAVPWHGEVVCARSAGGCGHVWKLENNADVPPRELGKRCVCGRELVGQGGTARAICDGCYQDAKAKDS